MPASPPRDPNRLGGWLRSWIRREDRTETIEMPPARASVRPSPLPPLAGVPEAAPETATVGARRDGVARLVALGALVAAILAATVLSLVLLRPATVGLARASDVDDAIAVVSTSIGNVEADIAQIEARVSELEAETLSSDEVEREVGIVRTRVEELSQDLSGLRSEVAEVDPGGFGARIESVERRLDAALTRLSETETVAQEDEGSGYCPSFLPLC